MFFRPDNIWHTNDPDTMTLKILLDLFSIVIVNQQVLPIQPNSRIKTNLWTRKPEIRQGIQDILDTYPDGYDETLQAWVFDSQVEAYELEKKILTKEHLFETYRNYLEKYFL